jgi:hypothetical protein
MQSNPISTLQIDQSNQAGHSSDQSDQSEQSQQLLIHLKNELQIHFRGVDILPIDKVMQVYQ